MTFQVLGLAAALAQLQVFQRFRYDFLRKDGNKYMWTQIPDFHCKSFARCLETEVWHILQVAHLNSRFLATNGGWRLGPKWRKNPVERSGGHERHFPCMVFCFLECLENYYSITWKGCNCYRGVRKADESKLNLNSVDELYDFSSYRLLVHFFHRLGEADLLTVAVPAEDWTPTAQDATSRGFRLLQYWNNIVFSTYWCVSISFKNWYSNWPDASHTIWGLVDVSPTLIQDSFLRTMGWFGLRVGPLGARRVILRCKMVSIGAVWQSKNQLMKIVFCGILWQFCCWGSSQTVAWCSLCVFGSWRWYFRIDPKGWLYIYCLMNGWFCYVPPATTSWHHVHV